MKCQVAVVERIVAAKADVNARTVVEICGREGEVSEGEDVSR